MFSKVPETRKPLLSVEIDKVAQVRFSLCILPFVSLLLHGVRFLRLLHT